MPFRVLSWNINGLRSFKTGMKEFLSGLEADIICFQETKVTRRKLLEPVLIVSGLFTYFSFQEKGSGYSGVATFCSQRATPFAAQEGLSGNYVGELENGCGTTEALPAEWAAEELKDLDSEGRAVITQHIIKKEDGSEIKTAVINVYCPRVDPEKPERRVYKLRFYELLRQRAAAIRSTGCHVLILGDINTSHKQIDHCDPDEAEVFERRLERRYLSSFLIPLYKKDDMEKVLCGHNEVDEASGDSDCKVKRDTHCHMSLSGTSPLLLSEEKEVSEKCLILEDVNTKIKVEKETLEKETYRDKQEGKTSSQEFEEYEVSDDHLLVSNTDFQVVDTFRYFYPYKKEVFTCWNTFTNSRSTNYGTRIDYVFCDEEFLPYVDDSLILNDIMGSDHCPVAVVIKGELVPSSKLPYSSTKFFPEFRGQQQKLSSYFQPQSSIPDGETWRNMNRNSLPKAGNLTDQSSHSTVKRKINNIKSSNKKNCADKQRKLSSFFSKTINDRKIAVVLPDKEAGGYESHSSDRTVNDVESTPTLIGPCQLNPNESDFKDILSDDLASSGECNSSQEDSQESSKVKSKNLGWDFLMKGPKPPPLCPGHKEPAVVMTVKKKGPNMNRQFYACGRGVGKEGDPNARCNFFKWVGK
nr:DNA-(apurinic or apyrimidinic site) endonuclease 2-like [Cherax quadricarinatus]